MSLKNKLFKIKNTDNYISYKGLKKTDSIKTNDNNYVPFNKNIKSNKSIKLKYSNVTIELNKGINEPILYMDKDNYYISYLNNVFSIKKDSIIKEIKHKNINDHEAKHVSVLHYDKISNNCEDKNCFEISKIEDEDILDNLLNKLYSIIN